MRRANPDYTVTSDEIRPDGDISLPDVDVARFIVPTCPDCHHDQLRPDVVFFGDTVPPGRVTRCHELIMGCAGLLEDVLPDVVRLLGTR